MRTRMKVSLGVALAGLLSAPEASAAVVCVHPTGVGGCETSIQAGVDAAGPGDLVKIAAGTYYENVQVPTGKDGLQIVGSSRVTTIVDPSPYSDRGIPNTFHGLVVHSRNVQVRNLMVRNGEYFGVLVQGPGVLIQGLNIDGPNVAGIMVTPEAWNVQVVQSEIHNTQTGVLSMGFGTLVKGSLVTGSLFGIQLLADGGRAEGNRVYGGTNGIYGLADGIVVKANDVRHQTQWGIAVQGHTYPVVERNQVYGAQVGILVECANCFGGSVSYNTVTDTALYGLLASADSPGLVVQNNVLLRTGIGISLNSTGIRVALNRATDVGTTIDGPCFEAYGNTHIVSRNTATRCSGSGFSIKGVDIYLDGNTALSTFENGFTVDGDAGANVGVTLVGNKTSLDAGQGIAIVDGAVGTAVTGNTATKNRTDFCDQGVGTVLSGNVFGTTGTCDILH